MGRWGVAAPRPRPASLWGGVPLLPVPRCSSPVPPHPPAGPTGCILPPTAAIPAHAAAAALTSSLEGGVGAVGRGRQGQAAGQWQALAVAVGPPQRRGDGHCVVQGRLVWRGQRLSHGQPCIPLLPLFAQGSCFSPHCPGVLPMLFLGGPRASPSPSGTCTPPMRPSTCSEGPWPGCFSRSVSVLGRGRRAVRVTPRSPGPTNASQP